VFRILRGYRAGTAPLWRADALVTVLVILEPRPDDEGNGIGLLCRIHQYRFALADSLGTGKRTADRIARLLVPDTVAGGIHFSVQ